MPEGTYVFSTLGTDILLADTCPGAWLNEMRYAGVLASFAGRRQVSTSLAAPPAEREATLAVLGLLSSQRRGALPSHGRVRKRIPL